MVAGNQQKEQWSGGGMKNIFPMPSTPKFWYGQGRGAARFLPLLLSPASWIYAAVQRQRFDMYYPVPMARPVVCVGNIVAGGAGKTPVTLALADLLQREGFNPHLLSRGYGGSEEGPLQVSPDRDTAEDVGDEALMLVNAAPTWVSKNRALGVQAAIDTGATVIIMDDGFQNPTFFKDVSVLVIDAASGFGNGRVIPAGPLREPFESAISRCEAVVLLGDDTRGIAEMIGKERAELPIFKARLAPAPDAPDLAGKQVYAFAGIGRPEKFRDTLVACGAEVTGWAEFPDHYPYTEEDLREMLSSAREKQTPVYTTAKDHVRLPLALRAEILPFPVSLIWEDEGAVAAFMTGRLAGQRGTGG